MRPNGEIRYCVCAAAMTLNAGGSVSRVNIVMIDITDRKQAEQRQLLLAREVDHRARNALAVVQAIVRLTRATTAGSLRRGGRGPHPRAGAGPHVAVGDALAGRRSPATGRARNWPLIAVAEILRVAIDGPAGVFCRPRKPKTLRLRCMNWRQIRQNTARFPWPRER